MKNLRKPLYNQSWNRNLLGDILVTMWKYGESWYPAVICCLLTAKSPSLSSVNLMCRFKRSYVSVAKDMCWCQARWEFMVIHPVSWKDTCIYICIYWAYTSRTSWIDHHPPIFEQLTKKTSDHGSHGTCENMEKSSTNGYRRSLWLEKHGDIDILPMKMWGAKPIIMGIQLEIYEDIRGYVRIHQSDIRQKLDHPKQEFKWESWWNSPKELWNIYEYPLVN